MLACGDQGQGAMAAVDDIVGAVDAALMAVSARGQSGQSGQSDGSSEAWCTIM